MFKDIVRDLVHALTADRYPWDITLYERAIDEIKALRQAGDALADWAVYEHKMQCKHNWKTELRCTCGLSEVIHGWNNSRMGIPTNPIDTSEGWKYCG